MAVTLLAVVLLAVLGVFPTSWAALHKAQSRLEADALASSLLEEQRERPWAELKAPHLTTLDPVGAFYPVIKTEQLAPDLKEVAVTVIWEHQGVRQQTVHSVVLVNLPR